MRPTRECCNPTARSDEERCASCPHRTSQPAVNQPKKEGEKPAEQVKRSLVWQTLHDELTRD